MDGFIQRQTIDLGQSNPVLVREQPIVKDDAQALVWVVTIRKNGALVDLAGAEASLYCARSASVSESESSTTFSGATVGSDGTVTATLPTDAANVPGPVGCMIRVTRDGASVAVARMAVMAVDLTGSNIIDVGKRVPNLDEVVAAVLRCEKAADKAEAAATKIDTMTVTATGLDAGAAPTAELTEVDGHYNLSFGVPKGDKGEPGETGPQGPQGEPGKDAVIDATLTKEGEAADAKAAGEAVSQLKEDVNPLTWNDGFMLQNGKTVAADGRSVSDFCLCPAETQVEYISETANQYVQGIVFYDKYKTPIIGYSNNGKDGEPCTVTSPKDTYYLRLSVVNSNIDKAYFKSSVPIVKSFIERNSNRLITAQDTDFTEIDVTNYMLICDVIKNKAYVVTNNVYHGLQDSGNKDSSTLCIIDKAKDMYAGNKYNVDVVFFDSDRKFISITNALYHGTKLAKEQYPSNAKYVAFTWSASGDEVIADKMYISTVDNGYQTGLPALKYGKTIKYKGQRPIINIYNSDTQEEIFDKLADACYTQDCDVYFEKGTYVFDTIYDKIKTYYNSVGDAFEMLLGGNCRYYMYGCTFKGDFTNSTGKHSTFGSHRHAGSYEIFGGTIICVDGVYCVHDEASGEEPLSVRKYHHVTFKYVKGSTYSNWICKCLGCGTGKNTITVIDGCYFESDNDLCVAEASWHGNNSDNSACETFIEVKNSYFKNKGFYIDAIPSDSKQVGKIMFCNNSVENKIPTEANGWTLAGWNNEIRNPSNE